jgi:hypothetical protein
MCEIQFSGNCGNPNNRRVFQRTKQDLNSRKMRINEKCVSAKYKPQ